LKRLALIPVSEVTADRGPVVQAGDSPAQARRVAEEQQTDFVIVLDTDEVLLGWVALADLGDARQMSEAPLQAPTLTVDAGDSLRAALNAMVSGQTGVAVRLSKGYRYEGIVT